MHSFFGGNKCSLQCHRAIMNMYWAANRYHSVVTLFKQVLVDLKCLVLRYYKV